MKRYLVIILVLFFSIPLFSQNAQKPETLKLKGKRSLLFNFNGLNLTAYQGGFGFKIWTSENTAFVHVLKIGVFKDKRGKTEYTNGRDFLRNNIGVELGMEKHFYTSKHFSPYWGIYLGVDYFYERTKFIPSSSSGGNESIRKNRSFQISPMISIGAEYFLNKRISLAAQYNLIASYAFIKDKTISNDTERVQDITQLSLKNNSAYLTLSIYLK